MIKPSKWVKAFENMGFGMFVHWGLYSQLGKGEWIYKSSKSSMDEYKKLADTFTAEDFDANELVMTAKNAGCKYITLTTRHHEGFSLYDTCGLNDFDAPHSAAKRDLVREFTDACNKNGIVPFFYHTTIDWYNKDFENDFDTYLEYLRQSVEILCRNYGKIGGLWFDGNWNKPNADWRLSELYGTIRKYQPEAMIINNTGMACGGEIVHEEIDSVTFEQGRPTPMNRENMKKYIAAEMCYTLNDHWGAGVCDFNYKSPRNLIETLCECRKVGANLLLNIGPTAQGGVLPIQRELMKIMGDWMNIYGEAIYEGRPYDSHQPGKNFVLKGNGCLYLFCFDLGINGSEHVTVNNGTYCGIYSMSGIKERVASAKWLDNGEELEFYQNNDAVTINLTGVPYGSSFVVRVCKMDIEE